MTVSASAPGDFLLQIADDGRQFDHDAQTSTGRGLANMRARASLIGAELAWNRIAGGGTLFSLKLKGSAEASTS
jgi:signal transduction histidine kinase